MFRRHSQFRIAIVAMLMLSIVASLPVRLNASCCGTACGDTVAAVESARCEPSVRTSSVRDIRTSATPACCAGKTTAAQSRRQELVVASQALVSSATVNGAGKNGAAKCCFGKSSGQCQSGCGCCCTEATQSADSESGDKYATGTDSHAADQQKCNCTATPEPSTPVSPVAPKLSSEILQQLLARVIVTTVDLHTNRNVGGPSLPSRVDSDAASFSTGLLVRLCVWVI